VAVPDTPRETTTPRTLRPGQGCALAGVATVLGILFGLLPDKFAQN